MKKIYRYTLGLLLLGIYDQVIVAQDHATALKTHAVYNHYYINPMMINPANTGFNGDGKLFLNYRNQWAGFDGAPRGITLGIDASPAPNMGLGGMIYSETFGVANRFQAQANYAYQFQANKDMRMAFGISGAYIQYNLDNETLTDPLHENPDPKINAAVNGEKYFAADFGFYAEIHEKYRIGISIPHLVQTRLDETSKNTQSTGDKPVSFVGFIGGTWKLPDYRIVLEPSVGLRKISDVPFGADFNLLAKMLEDRLFAGFTYSYNPSWHRISFLGGVRLDKLSIYYSYDQSYLDFQNFNNGSHEVTVALNIFKAKPKTPKPEENMMKEEVGEKKM